jgi:hypothetical protein
VSSSSPGKVSPTTRDRKTLFTKFIFKRHKMPDQEEGSQEPANTGPKDEMSIAPQAPPNVWRIVDKNRESCN